MIRVVIATQLGALASPSPAQTVDGVWLDTRGEILELEATVTVSSLTTVWCSSTVLAARLAGTRVTPLQPEPGGDRQHCGGSRDDQRVLKLRERRGHRCARNRDDADRNDEAQEEPDAGTDAGRLGEPCEAHLLWGVRCAADRPKEVGVRSETLDAEP